MTQNAKILVLAVLLGALAGAIAGYAVTSLAAPSKEQLISEFYLTEDAVHVSPHSLRGKMDKGDQSFVLVDLRSEEEYEKEHIVGAISIPAYSDKNTSAYGDINRIVGEFAKLPKGNDVIVYCYSTPCMTGRKIGKMLSGHGIYVKHLGIGWNEWRYDWTGWNHEHEWNITKADDYVWSGKGPGKLNTTRNSTACPIQNGFGC